jgi:hypothetical protein
VANNTIFRFALHQWHSTLASAWLAGVELHVEMVHRGLIVHTLSALVLDVAVCFSLLYYAMLIA